MSKVMIVDDDRTMNTLLQTLLELDGFSVVLAPRAELIFPTAVAEKPDVILMDVHIGEADGLEILHQMRQHPDLSRVPVVMSSGMDLEEQCEQAGANAFILKPYPPEQLLATLNKVMA
ncbi:MAG TPA: response regulator [Anaerolineales bacterium]|nr:response regulator [Anaerolineales bacterium]